MKKQVKKTALIFTYSYLLLLGCMGLFIYTLVKGPEKLGAILGIVLTGVLLLVMVAMTINVSIGLSFQSAVEGRDLEKAEHVVARCERLGRVLPFLNASGMRIVLYGIKDDIPALKQAISDYRSRGRASTRSMRVGTTAYLCAMVALDEGRSVDAREEYRLFSAFYREMTRSGHSPQGRSHAAANRKKYDAQAQMLEAVFTRLDGGYAVLPEQTSVYPVVGRVLERSFGA